LAAGECGTGYALVTGCGSLTGPVRPVAEPGVPRSCVVRWLALALGGDEQVGAE